MMNINQSSNENLNIFSHNAEFTNPSILKRSSPHTPSKIYA